MSATRTKGTADPVAAPWAGPTRHYDIFKEGFIALVVVGLLAIGLAAAFSSPDEPALTFQGWAKSASDNFYATTVSELAGTSESAGYGPPYNSASDGVSIGPLFLQKWAGVTHPVDSASDFVITPLTDSVQTADVTSALAAWTGATADQQTAWATSYDTALNDPDGANGDKTKVPAGDYGPVPALADGLLGMATSGEYDAQILGQGQAFYQMDATRQILFLGDGSYLDDFATANNLQGDTWGMMNEVGSYPGQAWLWMPSLWYQLPQFNDDEAAEGTLNYTLTSNADAIIIAISGVVTLILLLVPFIPGRRSIPRWIPLHRLIWRDYYRTQRAASTGADPQT